MIRGLYTAASGMLAEMTRNDVTSNNLANVNTTGFKKDTAIFKGFPEMLIQRIDDQKGTEAQKATPIGTLGTGAIVDEIITGQEQGPLKETTNPFDLAIEGDGYFVVQNQNGNFYTRNGAFTLDSQGNLVNSQGDYLLGKNGIIHIGNADKVVIDSQGNVMETQTVKDADGFNKDEEVKLDTIRLATIADKKQAVKVGDTLFESQQATDGASGIVRQNFLEASNVNVVTEMVNMITVMRAYEANQKVISAHDQTLAQVMEVGSIRS